MRAPLVPAPESVRAVGVGLAPDGDALTVRLVARLAVVAVVPHVLPPERPHLAAAETRGQR